MTESYQQLLVKATSGPDKAESVRILANILSTKDGRDFILHLDHKAGESCIQILDKVSRDSCLVPLNLSRFPGPIGSQAP